MKYLKTYCYLGALFALAFLCLSLTPSLLPRPWLMQGVVSGLAMAIGYGIGVLVSVSIRWLVQSELPYRIKSNAWKFLFFFMPVAYVTFIGLGELWQNDVRRLVGEQPQPGNHLVQIAIIAVLVYVLVISLSRLIRKAFVVLQHKIDKYLPWRLSAAIAVICVSVVLYWMVSGLLLSTLVSRAREHYAVQNDITPPGISQPVSASRSGSPESLVPWDTLGRQGQSFVATGPTQDQLKDFTGSEPKPQIRLYAGLKSSPTAEDRANLILREMRRTGAFDRKVIILATTTGTGWLEPQSVDSLEYMYGGDSAIVTEQYSDLPSWISFLVDKQKATDAGQALYNAVYGEWVKLPKETRPKLIAYGLSLGSYGGQSAYSSVQDLALSIDGALFVGTPSETLLWRKVTEHRDAGSPEWQPVYDGGKTVRFAATNEDLAKSADNWVFPRVLYMQHASDSVVWFNFKLPFNKPDWLVEPRGNDVSTSMLWYPIVTFLQVTVDQFYGVKVPNGHGHNYSNTVVAAWSSVVPPVGWNPVQTQKLQTIIDAYPND